MITPVFKLEQDNEFLTVSIRAPYANVKDAEIAYEGQTFLFVCKPYFLRLFLSNEVVPSDEDDAAGSSFYNCDTSYFAVKVPKKVKGENFANLDMLSELLQPQKKLDAGRMVEEVASEPSLGEHSTEEGNALGESTDEIFAEQALADENLDEIADGVSSVCGYGYGWKRHGVLLKFQEEIAELIDLKQPDQVPIDQRVELCLKYDKEHFAEEHYLADLFEPDDQLIAAINFEIDENTHLVLNDLDREQLKNLRIRQLDGFGLKSMQQLISYSLLDLVGAYLYDLRTTDGEHSVESGWTIRKLSPSLSFLVQWPDAKAAMAGFLRRSLVFPLYRSWQLSLKVLNNIVLVLEKGRSAILKCLLEIRRVFNMGANDCYYLFNQLFLDDFCLWIQSVDDSVITCLTEKFKLARNDVKKECLALDLDRVELEAGLELLNVDSKKMVEELDSDDEGGEDLR